MRSTPKAEMQRLKRKQIDDRLRRLADLRVIAPRRGWLHEIRTALGMSLDQLARRLKITPVGALGLEQSEAAGSITLKRLRSVADAMECDVLVALVPRRGSLEDTVLARAREKAVSLDSRVLHTMALERQSKGIDWNDSTLRNVEWWMTDNLRRLWD
jgi:predicted DNA-binding mobile mystery protein A